VPGVALVAAAAPDAAPQQQAATRFNNYARKIEDRYGKPYYEWRVFVDEPQKVLDSIEQVDYVLHPTFPEPFQTSRDRNKNFELRATGWGGFTIVITIHYVDGHVAKTSYFLDLQKSWPAVTTASKPLQLKLDRIVANQDGSAGSTGWVFDVLLDGRKLLHLPNRSYDDGLERSKKGNTYGPDGASWVVGPVRIGSGQSTRIDVIGERSSGHDKATGTATLPANGGALAVNVVNAADRKKGSFTFYFSTVPM
jgi:hypothetical protein